ncbi:cation transporter/ATPase, family protein [Mycobacterium kansasii 732]|nr:cation transporter/ATPase, family protein [Mycobacterium kansasii 732]
MSAAPGLTDAEVARRLAEGKSNDIPERTTRSVAQIIRANVFTRINAILGVLLVIVLATGSVINGLFGLLIIANSIIGMIQELRAKQTLDSLAILGQAKPWCAGDPALRPGCRAKSCWTTSSNSGRETRLLSTVRSSRIGISRLTNHC